MLPNEAVANENFIPGRINIGLALLYTALNVGQFFVLPAFVFQNDLRWAWALLPIALLNNPYWSLLHEAIHDLFHPDSRINLLFGRTLSVMFGSPFCILRLSHLLHHKLNRTPIEGTEFYQRGKVSVVSAAAGYYFQILGGLYLVEFLSPLLFFLPRAWLRKFAARGIKPNTVSAILMRSWTQDQPLHEIRTDGLLIGVWFGTALYCYGRNWPLLVAIVAARGLLISFLDNVYHYRTPVGDIFYAKNLWLPRPGATILLNFNLHGIHHRHPAVSWRGLPLLFREQAEIYEGNYFAASVRQLCGPVALQDLPRAQ
ncbi:MAG: fatty acid desaturase family protein [Alphaproteobacteria bacterium]